MKLRKLKRDIVISVVHGRDLVGVYFADTDGSEVLLECSPKKADKMIKIWNVIIVKMEEEKLFKEFLEEYFENVKKELPESYRARQLNAGGIAASLVYDFETKFLKEPFLKAIRKAKEE